MSLLNRTCKAAMTLSVAAIAAAGCSADAPTESANPAFLPVADARGVPHREGVAALRAVLRGNAQSVVAAPDLVPPGAPLPPFIEARLYAIANIAMHDALNAIVPRFERYADTGPIDRTASPASAVLTAVRDAIVGANPAAQAATDAWYSAEVAKLGDSPGHTAGVALGNRVASAILARRAGDGTAGGGVAPYHPGSEPGDYQFTFPFNTPGFDFFGTGGFADGSVWGSSVAPFVVSSTAQFRAPAPYGSLSSAAAVQTAQYTRDYDEVKRLGCATCAERTTEQTEIALFWVENSPTGWNRIARIIIEQRRLDAWNAARLLALLQMGEFDAYATSLESKYHHEFWRPVSAVALAGTDGNPATSDAVGWEVLAFPTPPAPDYPSAHATAGGAAAAIIEALVPGRGRRISTTSGSLPGVTRTFATVGAAAEENALSRIYVGYHFRHAVDVGLRQGREVGDYVVANALTPIR